MTKSERLQPIVKVSESRERHAARKLAEAMQRQRQAEERLKELQRYRDEYEQVFQRDAHYGVRAEKLRDYRSFAALLNQGIEHQNRRVNEAAAACGEARRAWLETRTRCQALDKAMENHCRAERRSAARREQRDSDEHAQRIRGEAIADEGE